MNITSFFIATLGLFFIGCGPSLFFLGTSYSRGICLSIWAPILGLILTTLIGTFLVLWDFPVLLWANLCLIVGCFMGGIIALYMLKKPAPLAVFSLDKNANR